MDNNELKRLCISLIKADSESEVIRLLKQAGYWDDPNNWRYYGDHDNNVGIIGNQQSSPDSALVEKLVNAVDAKLMSECLEAGIDPESDSAPDSIRNAVIEFFEDEDTKKTTEAGLVRFWGDTKRTSIARGISLVATGYKPSEGQPCLTISDNGEGQTPSSMPDTLLSLARSNKIKIQFVQGQFNQGGSGVLRFCGNRIKQLVISRRNPHISEPFTNETDGNWGFTVVRREDPIGTRRNSAYTYLAPVDAGQKPRSGGVLSFKADAMPIFSKGNKAYVADSGWGTLIKLYEYENSNFDKSNIIQPKGGLRSRMDMLLPDIALPIRCHECRPYAGKEGSFENNINGLSVKLFDDAANNIEQDWSAQLNVDGERLYLKIYVFRPERDLTYRKNEGVIFTLNGQTQGSFSKDFFMRKKVMRMYLRRSLFVIIDCSRLSNKAIEQLFMNSRDRISGSKLSKRIENDLEYLLRNHSGLREIEEKRRREEAAKKLEDDKPLEDILKNILKKNSYLADFFLKGIRASNPMKTDSVASNDKSFKGEQYPSFFRFKGSKDNVPIKKRAPINSRAKILFETDAVNDYFGREIDPGIFRLNRNFGDDLQSPAINYASPSLHNGTASLYLNLPENVRVGDKLDYQAIVDDSNRVEPFINDFCLVVVDKVEHKSGGSNKKRKPPSDNEGNEHNVASGIKMPEIQPISEKDWSLQEPHFDKYTALRIIETGDGGIYDFKVNVDNIYLKTELKSGNSIQLNLIKHRFIYGMVLIGLCILQDRKNPRYYKQQAASNIFDIIEDISRGIAPVLLPMINSLAELEVGDISGVVGEHI